MLEEDDEKRLGDVVTKSAKDEPEENIRLRGTCCRSSKRGKKDDYEVDDISKFQGRAKDEQDTSE